MRNACYAILAAFAAARPAAGGDLRLLPGDVVLTGPHATQRLLVVEQEGGRAVGDRTPQARFQSAQPAVADVDAAGTVRAVGDGTTTITAAVEGRQAQVQVRV